MAFYSVTNSRSIDLCQLYIPLSRTYNYSNTTYWRPSDKLQKSLTLRLVSMRSPQPAKWVVRNNDTTYSLQTSFQINLTTNPHNPVKIAICDEYKLPNNRTCLTLAPTMYL